MPLPVLPFCLSVVLTTMSEATASAAVSAVSWSWSRHPEISEGVVLRDIAAEVKTSPAISFAFAIILADIS